MPDRFTVIIDHTGATYPSCVPTFWAFDEDTRRGTGWRSSEAAHRAARELNSLTPEAVRREERYLMNINGLENLLGR